MRTFATGVVSLIGGLALLAAVCVTIIGIPIAVVAALAAIIATIAAPSSCSKRSAPRSSATGPRTRTCTAFGGLLLVAGAILFVGAFVRLAVVLTAIGSSAPRALRPLPDASTRRQHPAGISAG